MKAILSITLLAFIGTSALHGEITYDNWPTAAGEAILSDKYSVTITQGTSSQTLKVLESSSWTEPGGGPDVFRNRTFAFGSFASDFSTPVTVSVTKLFGSSAPAVQILPSGYGITSTLSEDGRSVTFSLNQSRYISVNFLSSDNDHAPGGIVRHMLAIFADPLETDIPSPTDPGTVVLSPATTQQDITGANRLFVPTGFHNLLGQLTDGTIILKTNQQLYLQQGAFLIGKVTTTSNAHNVRVYGRGLFSGRDYDWIGGTGPAAHIEIKGNNSIVEGIHLADFDKHGIVPGPSTTMRNIKLWGWHYNNDGFRPWGGTVDHCFLRTCDDGFYVGGNLVTVTDTVIWQSFNGAVVTCGWGSPENPYDTADFVMRDCHIIHPEWNGIGNNNGIIASQLPYNASSTRILIENLRVDGDICALTNLKRDENKPITGTAGGISHVTFKNVEVFGSQVEYNYNRTQVTPSKSRIRGEQGFRIEHVLFDNLRINGSLVTEANKDSFFIIDPATTSDIIFSDTSTPVYELELINNPEFTTDLDGWSEYNGGNCDIVHSPELGNSDPGAVTITNRTNRWTGVQQDILPILRANGPGYYRYSASALSAGSPLGAYVTLRLVTSAGTTYFPGSTITLNSTTWQNSIRPSKFIDPADLTAAFLYFETNSTATDSFHVDDFSLVKLDPAGPIDLRMDSMVPTSGYTRFTFTASDLLGSGTLKLLSSSDPTSELWTLLQEQAPQSGSAIFEYDLPDPLPPRTFFRVSEDR